MALFLSNSIKNIYLCRAKIASSLEMDALKHFSIPLRGLGNSLHQFEFQVDKHFFSHFEDSLIQDGEFKVLLELDKRTDVMELDFSINGAYKTECDRCLTEINLPVHGEHNILAKYSELRDEEAEVIYIHPQAHELNVSKYIYEFISLSIPLIKSYDCQSEEKPPCDESMLEYLEDADEDETVEDEIPNNNPFIDALKDLNKDNN